MNFSEIINSSSPVLIDFYADWCEPCKWLNPILEDVKKELGTKISIHKIDIDQHEELKNEYSIMSVPVLMLFKNGKLLWRMNGFMVASDLVKKLEEII